MDAFLEEDFELMKRLKQEIQEDDIEIRNLLNKKHLSKFELDLLMNQGI